jgi:hypothetical protein
VPSIIPLTKIDSLISDFFYLLPAWFTSCYSLISRSIKQDRARFIAQLAYPTIITKPSKDVHHRASDIYTNNLKNY